MRVNLISDLHLEFADLELPGGDVLIISGDACEVKNVKKASYDPALVMLPHERKDQRPDRFYRFFEEECKKYNEVIYVFGNHEHYGFQIQKSWPHMVEQLPDNIHILENDTHTVGDVTFVGGTMWTDMNKGDALTRFHLKQYMNDYRQITMFNSARAAYHRLIPEYTEEQHYKTRDYIRTVVEANPDNKFVVVTHHAPTKLSVKPKYEGDALTNGGYSSDMSEFILDHPQIKVWTHGHTHDQFDYMVGGTRILCNPRGYKGYEHQAEDFDPTFGFDI